MVRVYRTQPVSRKGRRKNHAFASSKLSADGTGSTSSSLQEHQHPTDTQSTANSTAMDRHSLNGGSTSSSSTPRSSVDAEHVDNKSDTHDEDDEADVSPDAIFVSAFPESNATATNAATPAATDPFAAWLHSADELIHSNEMANFVLSSRDVISATGGMLVHTACLPITLPLHLFMAATHNVAGIATDVVHHIIRHNPSLMSQHSGEESSASRKKNIVDDMVVPAIMQTASPVLQLLSPLLGWNNDEASSQQPQQKQRQLNGQETNESTQQQYSQLSAGESSSEQDHFLDRLRIDHMAEPYEPSEPSRTKQEDETSDQSISNIPPQPSSPGSTEYLLRVDDLNLSFDGEQALTLVDLHSTSSSSHITSKALDSFVYHAMSIICTNPFLQNPDQQIDATKNVTWAPEGYVSRKVEQTFKTTTSEEMYTKLENETWIWSGMYNGSKVPLYTARGMVQVSLTKLLETVWDSARSHEYNHYSLGRSDLQILDGEPTLNANQYNAKDFRATKIVTSETKVPFTGMSVKLCTLMHVRALDDDQGFIIVSRSVHAGIAGNHFDVPSRSSPIKNSGNNELLLGINILRVVPGRPDWTDLISVSQFAPASFIPRFLSKKVGMAGLDDFFKNVRSLRPTS